MVSSRFALKKALSVTAASVMVILMAGTYYTTSTAASSVTVESDSGTVNLSLNHLNRVIKVEVEGTDDSEITSELYDMGIKGDELSDALTKTTEVLAERGLVQDGEGPMIEIEAKSDKTLSKLKDEVAKSGVEINKATQKNEAPGETTTPKDSNSQKATPQDTIPQESTPQEAVPQESTPQASTPQEAVPQESTPQESTPQEAVPQEAAPQDVAPQESVPQSTAPQDATPQGATPQGATPQGAAPQGASESAPSGGGGGTPPSPR
ncbi:MAG: hypothetical protein K6F66_02800 [Pseudobutyrivibrio sp.]|nr:hypothetical protein [Pseudobutyrivibrio sp.]